MRDVLLGLIAALLVALNVQFYVAFAHKPEAAKVVGAIVPDAPPDDALLREADEASSKPESAGEPR